MPEGPPPDWHPRHGPWAIALGVMLATFMQVLDTSIATVALPHIAGSLSASTDEATWVLTSYMVANAIILPMTGWLANRFGRKRVFISCIVIFTIASILCGMAINLPMLILARILQGAGGGAMVPMAQAIMLESFPPEKRGIAMATFAQGVIVAPIIGPTLGGWITDNFSWRWVFYINLPVGILAVFLAQWLVQDPPYIKRDVKSSMDIWGFGFLAIWLSTLQIALDKGQEADWFGTVWIRWFFIISAVSMVAFIWRQLTVDHPLTDLRVFKNRNFAVGVLLITVIGAILYGTTAELPLFLQTLMGYPALQSGYAMSPRGLGAFVATFLVGQLVGKVRLRWLMFVGFFLLSLSALMLSDINLQVSMASIVLPGILNGVATSFIFVPLTTATMSQLNQRQIGNAAGLYNLMLNIGGSSGIAFVTTMIARKTQEHQALMVSNLSATDPAFVHTVNAARGYLMRHADPVTALHQAYALVGGTLDAQAHLWAFVDNFRVFALLAFCSIPLILLFRRVKQPQKQKMDVAAH
ncbi:MAG TPA: DHA2 family efflux MFS transporter permease subunit [Verrucomicrobiae bacterium]|jgi:DHA2 family multidrug resistance protein